MKDGGSQGIHTWSHCNGCIKAMKHVTANPSLAGTRETRSTRWSASRQVYRVTTIRVGSNLEGISVTRVILAVSVRKMRKH